MLTIIWQCRVAMNLQIVRKKKNTECLWSTMKGSMPVHSSLHLHTVSPLYLQDLHQWLTESTGVETVAQRANCASASYIQDLTSHIHMGFGTCWGSWNQAPWIPRDDDPHRNHYQRVITSPLSKYLQTINIKKIQFFLSVSKIHLPSWEGIQFLHPFNKFWRKSSFPWVYISFVWFYETSSCKAIDVYIEYNTTNSIKYWHWTILICV